MKHYEIIRHRKMLFDEHSKCFPSETIKKQGGVYVQKCIIPYCHETSKVVYFVNGINGDSYGQYTSKGDAMERLEYLLTLPELERHGEDL